MLRTLEGIYRNGYIELIEPTYSVGEETRVLVTLLQKQYVSLEERGISRETAAILRERLMPYPDEWDSPEMDLYNDYDAAKAASTAG